MLTLCQLAKLSLFSTVNILNITPLIDGLSHQLYKMTFNSINGCQANIQHYVLRFIKKDIDKTAQEYAIMQRAYVLGIAPKPIACIDVTEQVGQLYTLIVMEYIAADLAVNTSFNNNTISQLTHCLNTLHNTDITDVNYTTSTNEISLLDTYWKEFTPKTIANINRFKAITHELQTITFKNTCLIHGDLNLSNILITADTMIWVDWEYSSIGDAYFDYATLCVESEPDLEEKLIAALEETDRLTHISIDRSRLTLFKLYYAAACWLWSPALSINSSTIHCERYEAIVDQLLLSY